MDVTSHQVEEFLEDYKQAARSDNRERFEQWLTGYAFQRCKILEQGIIWDDAAKFGYVDQELLPADKVALKVGQIGNVTTVDQVGYRFLDAETLVQAVRFANDMCILFLKEGEEWKVLAMFRVVAPLDWSPTAPSEQETRVDDNLAESDDDYWDQYDKSDEERDSMEKTGDAAEQTEEEYYAQYDSVEPDADPGHEELDPVKQHITDSIASLKKLALASGMSPMEFGATVMTSL